MQILVGIGYVVALVLSFEGIEYFFETFVYK